MVLFWRKHALGRRRPKLAARHIAHRDQTFTKSATGIERYTSGEQYTLCMKNIRACFQCGANEGTRTNTSVSRLITLSIDSASPGPMPQRRYQDTKEAPTSRTNERSPSLGTNWLRYSAVPSQSESYDTFLDFAYFGLSFEATTTPDDTTTRPARESMRLRLSSLHVFTTPRTEVGAFAQLFAHSAPPPPQLFAASNGSLSPRRTKIKFHGIFTSLPSWTL